MNIFLRDLLATLCLVLLLVVSAPVRAQETQPAESEPTGMLLTWMHDPTRTMTIDWHTAPAQDPTLTQSELHYREIGQEQWQDLAAAEFAFPYSDRKVHRVELTGLKPGMEYQFRLGGFPKVYLFRTLPSTIEPGKSVVFAIGGDTHPDHAKMTHVAMSYDPAFVVWGGDLAYSDGREDRIAREYEWYNVNMKSLVTEQGRVVPLVVSIGNHEMKRQRGGNSYYDFPEFKTSEEFAAYSGDIEQWRRDNAPYFYALLAFPGQPGYGVLDFGNYLSLLLLDPDYTNPIQGKQAQWLEKTLQQRVNIPHVFPVYHEPAYPSVASFDVLPARLIREFWTPLFDKYNVKIAFENHNHAYKRTPPIRGQKLDPQGVVYMGDGAWGVTPRKVHPPAETWYLKRAETVRHAIIVTLGSNQRRHLRVVSEEGKLVDQYPED